MLKIVADENIALTEEAFSSFGNVVLLSGRKITNEVLKTADVLLVRSVTNVNEQLLNNTPVKFIGTATIGVDHIDVEYLESNKIYFTSAKGCNAYAVAEYVITAIASIVKDKRLRYSDLTIGIVGYGNIGSKAASYSSALGMKVLLNDPPLQRLNNNIKFVSINEIEKADIITLHVPLNIEGIDKTFHLFDKERLSGLKNDTIFINTSRGSVTDNNALKEVLQSKPFMTVLDVWENEPLIDIELLKKVSIATPHIAGYSLEGKVNGTKIIYDALCNYLDIQPVWSPSLHPVKNNFINVDTSQNLEDIISSLTSNIYDIIEDDKQLKSYGNIAEHFDLLRKNYHLRREFENYFVGLGQNNPNIRETLTKLRFKT